MPTIVISNNSTGADYSGTDDCDMQSSAQNTNNGSDSTFWSHSYGGGNDRIGLIKFTLPGVLSGATITSATLDLYVADNSGTRTHNLHKMLRNWVESQACWDLYATGSAWTTGGGRSDGNDRVGTASVGLSISSAGSYVSWSGAGLVADVQAWVDSGSNYGWSVARSDFAAADLTYTQFVSSEGTDGQRPKLTIDYTAGGGGGSSSGVPAPRFNYALLNH